MQSWSVVRAVLASCVVAVAPARADYFDNMATYDAARCYRPMASVCHNAACACDRAPIPSVASADPPPADAPPPAVTAATAPVDWERRPAWQAELDARLGSAPVDGASAGTVFGLAGAGGIRLARLALLGEYGLTLVSHHAM